ncbi:di-heme-cytochrome C peroxidase [Methylobacterium sp. J-070]|uniref:di-heme-cytochrome C peroxidase n=1 Tax=Methylobacterium sp. J-070 TaxID=2836650 RepID=UPI001FB9835D|nr:di-heme-cytochrome C peroxidase [Methylobacterium sp. J-070]MCJ2052220.1 di-heme-cytochrome C peroxidase [Methylobacterium sp. J-070]
MSLARGFFAAAWALLPILTGPAARAQSTLPGHVDQGSDWTDPVRRAFYVQSQGSELMPLAWLKALKQPDGTPFLAGSLSRYGYLPNPDSRDDLPVGFTFAGPAGAEIAGMTCAACHTRQIMVDGTAYRIDGGPAIADFQSLLGDLDAAVGAILASEAAFEPFAKAVLGEAANDTDAVQNLTFFVKAWYDRYHTLMTRALPKTPWGPARLDAVGMIFNRVTGLDIGDPPNTMIPDNIRVADAPTRYPFLWNAWRQDRTQWPGFAENGNDSLAFSRNLGQVLGVFGRFHPRPDPFKVLLEYDYLSDNSANFNGLRLLEDAVKKIGPPRWRWGLQTTLVEQGKTIFERETSQGSCKGCHWPSPGARWPGEVETWKTPFRDVGTDSREHGIMQWRAKSGVLTGAQIPLVQAAPLKADNECAISILANSVAGSIIQSFNPLRTAPPGMAPPKLNLRALPQQLRSLANAFPKAGDQSCASNIEFGPYPYEARVLEGIWAAAPYLHNGSVATLADLLEKPDKRRPSFKIGSNYDIEAVGLAKEQTQFDYTLNTTDCTDRNSGNSRCGHDYGTDLTADEKKALLEYLKSL